MVMNVIDELLNELGKTIEVEDLKLDSNNTCLIKFETGLEVHIEPYESDDFLLICTDFGTITAGRYREDVFLEALKANGLHHPRWGTFACSNQSDHFLLFELLPIKDLNGEKIANFLYSFMDKANYWKNNIDEGRVPVAETMTTSSAKTPGGLFGLT